MTDEKIVVTVIGADGIKEIVIHAGENLLLAMVRANFPVDFMCTTGKCTSCRLRITKLDGSLTIATEVERYRLGDEAIAHGFRLTCQVYVDHPLIVHL